MSSFYASLIEIPKKKDASQKASGIIANGDDNQYPERVERCIVNSVTASQCVGIFKKFVVGKGTPELNEISLGELTYYQFLDKLVEQYAQQGGCAVHVRYKVSKEGEVIIPSIASYDILPFNSVRLGKNDDMGFSGRIGINEDWAKPQKTVWAYPFDPTPEVVLSQINKCKGIAKYYGQVAILNTTDYHYPLSFIHPVLNDCDSEFRIGVFKNKNLRSGLFSKKIFIVPPIVDKTLLETPRDQLSSESLFQLTEQQRQRSNFEETVKKFMGAENNEGAMILEMEHSGDDIEKVFKTENVATDINDKLFEHTEKSISNNIRKVFNNVPSILVENSDNSIFGQSGELLTQAKIFYQEQTVNNRRIIEVFLKRIFKKYAAIETSLVKLSPLISTDESVAIDKNAEAQAVLRGSVGGVTALLEIQKSVAQGLTDIESGVAIIVEIYGIDENTARRMLGTPKPIEPEVDPIKNITNASYNRK